MSDEAAHPVDAQQELPSPPLLSQQPPEFGLPLEVRMVGLTLAIVLGALLVVVYLGVGTAAAAIESEWKLRGQQAAEGLEGLCNTAIVAAQAYSEVSEETALRGRYAKIALESGIDRLLKSSAGFSEIVVFGSGQSGLEFVVSAPGVPERRASPLDLQAFVDGI